MGKLKSKGKGFFTEFKEFINKGNAFMLAVGVVIGGAFSAIVNAFVNMLMSLATYQKTPLWVTVMAVATFILAGFNHCIADFYYMLTGGIFSWNLLATIAGNIIGGIFLSAQGLKANT